MSKGILKKPEVLNSLALELQVVVSSQLNSGLWQEQSALNL